jgi:hypothetical protein
LGNKYIPKITVFIGDVEDLSPTMLFWVADSPTNPPRPPDHDPMDTGPGKRSTASEPRNLKRSTDGKSVLREHVFRAKL